MHTDPTSASAVTLPSSDPSSQRLTLKAGLALEEIERRLLRLCRQCDVHHRAIAFYLHDMHERGLHALSGHASTVHFAVSRLGLSERYAREHLAAGRALLALSRIDAAFFEEQISWTKVRLLLRVVVPETEAEWLERALSLSTRQLDHEVSTSEPGRPPRKNRLGRAHTRFRILARVDATTFAAWESAKAKLSSEAGSVLSDAEVVRVLVERALLDASPGEAGERRARQDSLFRVLVQSCGDCGKKAIATSKGFVEADEESASRIENEGIGVTLPEDLDCHRNGPTPDWLRRWVLTRDQNCCVVCGTTGDLEVHHVRFRSKGGETIRENLCGLCKACHAHVHDGFLEVSGTAPDGLTFTDREGRPLDGEPDPVGPRIEIEREAEREEEEENGRNGTRVPPLNPTPNGGFSRESLSVTLPSPPAVRRLTLSTLPAQMDASTWRSIADAIRWNERRRLHEILPEFVPHPGGEPEALSSPRAVRFSDLIGQRGPIEALAIAAMAAKKRNAPVRHALLTGPPGLGKTSLAAALANEMGASLSHTSGPLLSDLGAVVGLLGGLSPKGILFIDELHAMAPAAAEVLYEAMEEGTLSIPLADGVHTRTVRVRLERFTVVGATTDPDRIAPALRSRFTLSVSLGFYEAGELARIVSEAARRDGVVLDAQAAALLGRVGRGTPRQALCLYASARDEAVAAGEEAIGETTVRQALARQGIDERGMTAEEQRMVEILERHGRPMGLSRLAAMMGLPVRTVRDVIEPYPMRLGLIVATPRGRALATWPARACRAR